MIWSRKQLVGPRMSYDIVNPRMLELETAKEILAELFDIRTHEVDEMISRGWTRGLFTAKNSAYPLISNQLL